MITNIQKRGLLLRPANIAALIIVAMAFMAGELSATAAGPFCGGPFQPPCPPIIVPCGRPGLPACPTPPPPPPPLCGAPGVAPCASTLSDTYYNTAVGDNVLRLINPLGIGSANTCAMIYVFDNDEEMGECCGCPLSPQKLLSLSVDNNLTANWGVTNDPHQLGVIDVVSAPPTGCGPNSPGCNGGCAPSALPGYTPAPELKAYIVHNAMVGGFLDTLPEVPLAGTEDDFVALSYLQQECESLLGNSSGTGTCNCGQN